jgi:hypothetical protein
VTLVDNEDCDFSAGTMVDGAGAGHPHLRVLPRKPLLLGQPADHRYMYVGGGAAREPEVECVGDVSGYLVVDVIDLLALLGAFGQSGEIAADLDATLLVDVSDLLMLFWEFGSTC